jgi:hypothetical protein
MCACTLALLLVAPATLATVIESGDYYEETTGNGSANASRTHSSAGSQSNGSSPGGSGGADGWQQLITTRGGYCDCSYYVSAHANAELYLYSGQDDSHALAQGYANAYIASGQAAERFAYAYVYGKGTGGEHIEQEDDPAPGYNQATNWWVAGNGPDAYHCSVAASDVPSGSDDTAFASASATAFVTMSEI